MAGKTDESNSVVRKVRFTSNVLRGLGIAVDVACLLGGYLLTLLAYRNFVGGTLTPQLHETASVILGINFFLIGISRDSYSNFRGQAEDVGGSTIADFFVAALLTSLTIVLFDKNNEFSRAFALIFLGIIPVLLFLGRIFFRKLAWWLMDLGYIGQKIIIYGEDRETVSRVVELFELERLPHVQIIGFADDRERGDVSPVGYLRYVGGLPEVLHLARSGSVDQVVIALPNASQDRLQLLIDQLSEAALDVCCISTDILKLKLSYRVRFIGSMPVFSLWQRPIRDFDFVAKALLDRGLALIALILLSPLLALVAIAIRIESPGKILFVQERFGFNNMRVNVYKFRSMFVDRQDQSGAERTTRGDPRVTRVGRIIRRLSIDELPQLFNVLAGNMSLVGPRPHATQMRVGDKFYFEAVEGYAGRHRVKPGITGLAQVRGLRGEIDSIERARRRVELDKYYIDNWSILLDLRIMVETLFIVVWDRHAY